MLARQHGGRAAALAPARAYPAAWHHLAALDAAQTFATLAPAAVPAGLAAGGRAVGVAELRHHGRDRRPDGLRPGHLRRPPVETPDRRRQRPQRRARLGPAAGPGREDPGRRDHPRHRLQWKPVFAVPAAACARHMVIIGATGCGKTNLMMRLWAGWYTAALDAYWAGKGDRPLLIVLDCKGGRDARQQGRPDPPPALRSRRPPRRPVARRSPRVHLGPAPGRPGRAAVPDGRDRHRQRRLLRRHPLRRHRPGRHRPRRARRGAPPRSWNASTRPGSNPPGAATRSRPAQVRAAARHLGDIQLRYATLLGRLGTALDGPGTLDEADAWYFILEGTREPSVAEAQALALTELAARAATTPAGPQRAIVLAADDYSAVSRRVPLSNLYERGRSLGIGVQVSAQTWQGLGADDDERYRIAGTADGGVWVMHTPYPEPLAMLAGTRRVLETAHKLIGNTWGDEGSTRLQHTWTADPDLIRRLQVGQACYISHGTATFVHVARPRPSPLTLLPAHLPAEPPRQPPPRRAALPPILLAPLMTCSDPEPPHDPPVRRARPAHPPRPDRRAGPATPGGRSPPPPTPTGPMAGTWPGTPRPPPRSPSSATPGPGPRRTPT